MQSICLFELFQLERQPNKNNTGAFIMRNEYDFSKSVKNPYAKHLKKME